MFQLNKLSFTTAGDYKFELSYDDPTVSKAACMMTVLPGAVTLLSTPYIFFFELMATHPGELKSVRISWPKITTERLQAEEESEPDDPLAPTPPRCAALVFQSLSLSFSQSLTLSSSCSSSEDSGVVPNASPSAVAIRNTLYHRMTGGGPLPLMVIKMYDEFDNNLCEFINEQSFRDTWVHRVSLHTTEEVSS